MFGLALGGVAAWKLDHLRWPGASCGEDVVTVRMPMEDDDSIIGQAQRVVMAKLRCDQDGAGNHLLHQARIEKRSLAETAAAVVASGSIIATTT